MVEDSIRSITLGNEMVVNTGKQLEEIVSGAAKVADLVEEIASASKEQAQGIEQINTGLEQVDQVTQSNTANAEESASAAEELASQSQQLRATIARFKLAAGAKQAAEGGMVNQELLHRLVQEELKRLKSAEQKQTGGKTPPNTLHANTKPLVNPKDVIKLDDENFGKF